MANGVFVIQELPGTSGRGAPFSGGVEEGARFDWTADTTPVDAATGGARACPNAPWSIGGELRTVKTWYPGAKRPSEQVLGPSLDDQTFEGKLDDRYNFSGFAVATKRRFEEMVARGNMVRVSYQTEAWEGIITKWSFPYRRSWQIEYSFTLSPHGKPEHQRLDRSPKTVRTPTQVVGQVSTTVDDTLAAHKLAPTAAMSGAVVDEAGTQLARLAVSKDVLGGLLDKVFGKAGLGRVTGDFGRLAAQVRDLRNISFELLQSLAELRSDVEVVTRTAMSVLNFEAWSRSLRFQSRILMGQSTKAAAELAERDEPSAERIYQPKAGESGYAISQKFYGTPHAWNVIADRNRLRYSTMLGSETLIIPQRGES